MKQLTTLMFASATLLFAFISTTSCKKVIEVIKPTTIDTVIVPGPAALLTIEQNPDWPGQQTTIAPGGLSEIGSFVVYNNSTTDTASLNLGNLIIAISQGDSIQNLQIQGPTQDVINTAPKAENLFIVGITMPPGSSRTFYAYVQSSKNDTGFIQAGLKINASWLNSKEKDTIFCRTQKLTFVIPVITSVTFVSDASTNSQFIASANSAIKAAQLSYNITMVGNGQIVINDLKLTDVSKTALSVEINGQSFPFINGTAEAGNINLYSWGGNSIGLQMYVSYPAVGIGGIKSGSTSQIVLTYLRYNNGTEDKEIYPNTQSNTMTLTGSKPIVSVLQPNVTLATGKMQAIIVEVQADPQGDIMVNTLPIYPYVSTGSVTIGSLTGIVVEDPSGKIIPTTTTVTASGIAVINLTGGYKISAGAVAWFSEFIPVSDVTFHSALSTVLDADNFSWTDLAGGGTTPIKGGKLIYNFPLSPVSIRNF